METAIRSGKTRREFADGGRAGRRRWVDPLFGDASPGAASWTPGAILMGEDSAREARANDRWLRERREDGGRVLLRRIAPLPGWLETWDLQQDLFDMMTGLVVAGHMPNRMANALWHLQRQPPQNLNPIIVWIVQNTVGFTDEALSYTPKSRGIAPEIADAEYDQGGSTAEEEEERELANLVKLWAGPGGKSARSARKRPSIPPRGVGGRVRRGSSGFLGVSFYARTGRWSARIQIEGKRLHLGYFPTAEEAAAAYDRAALFYLGASAVVNDSSRKEVWRAMGREKPGTRDTEPVRGNDG